jgi:DNA-directed RNA polymerase III subunit RPC4
LLFFQLPSSLSLPNQTQSVEEPNTGSEENAELGSAASEMTSGQKRPPSFQGSKIKDLPGGLMGKILIYKSGEVKMKIGDALFDVSISPVACCFLCEHICSQHNTKN